MSASGQAWAQGGKSCAQLSAGDFERAGEAWMGRMLGSASTHEAMDQLMSSMMGSSAEQRMHEYMGRRVSGCAAGGLPAGFDRMMNGTGGMMGMMAMMSGSGGSSGMMGGGGQSARYGPGSMMGGSASNVSDDDDDMSGWGVAVMIAVVLLLLVGLYFAFRGRRGREARETPADILKRRLASGEINRSEYEQRLKLLTG